MRKLNMEPDIPRDEKPLRLEPQGVQNEMVDCWTHRKTKPLAGQAPSLKNPESVGDILRRILPELLSTRGKTPRRNYSPQNGFNQEVI